jgi:hypothetical protein
VVGEVRSFGMIRIVRLVVVQAKLQCSSKERVVYIRTLEEVRRVTSLARRSAGRYVIVWWENVRCSGGGAVLEDLGK